MANTPGSVSPPTLVSPDDALYVVTDQGRRAVAAAALFDPSPTVADVVASRLAR